MSAETGTGAPQTTTASTPEEPPKKAWGAPLLRLDEAWVALEQRLCVWVIVAEIAVLCVGVSLTGLSAFFIPGGGNVAGIVYRAFLTATLLGIVAHLITRPKATDTGEARKRKDIIHQVVTTIAVFIGLALGRAWANGGVDYFSNFRAWMQNSSALMLIGGLRGVVTRLTLWLALLGASIATSKGKHINIDVATRYIPKKLVAPVAIVGWGAAAIVCFAATWAFIDGISVTKFGAEAFTACKSGEGEGTGHLCDTPIGARLATTTRKMSSDFFLLGRQVSLDFKSFPKVVAGERYDKWMKAAEWNAWLGEADWTAHFDKGSVESLKIPDSQADQPKMPAVTAPGASNAGGLLIRDLNFILPFGLLVIGIKFIVRILLVFSGHVRVDLDSAHGDDEAKHFEHHDAADDLGAPDPHAAPGTISKGAA